jgi:major membrane immunogen (membrane-anchored lipoprotein)
LRSTARNSTSRREHGRNWESRNPDKVRAQVRRKYEKHAEAIKAKQRAYTKTERGRLVRAINNYRRRGRIKEGDATYEYMEKLRAETLTCSVCHHTMNDVIGSPQRKSIDHIVPLCIGGEHSNANLRCICNRCNTLRPKDGSDLKRTNYALAS